MNNNGIPGTQNDNFSRSPADWMHLEKELNQLKMEDLPQQRQMAPSPQQQQQQAQQQSEIPSISTRANTAPPKSLLRFLNNSSPAPIREDIRYDEQYQQFFREYNGPHHLPPPIEENSVLGMGRTHFTNQHQQISSDEDAIKQLERITMSSGGGQQQTPFHHSISPMGSNPGTPGPPAQPDMSAVLQFAANQARVLNSVSPPVQPGTPQPVNGIPQINQLTDANAVMNGLEAVQQQVAKLQQQQQIASVFAQANAAQWANNNTFAQMPLNVGQASALLAAIGGGGSGTSNSETNNNTSGNASVQNQQAVPTSPPPASNEHIVTTAIKTNRGRRGGRHARHHQNQEEDPTTHYNEKYQTSDDIIGHVMEIASDQYGCRFLQKMMDTEGKPAMDKFFPEIVQHTVNLMKDPFGNYLVQKVLEVCSEQQCTEVLRMATRNGDLVEAALNTHGTRAVQKLLEIVKTQEQVEMVIATFEPKIMDLIMDLNGNHVIQKFLQKLGSKKSKFVYEACYKRTKEVAKHRHGCCVLQRCIDFATVEQKHELVEKISAHSYELSQDQYGNYVVQYVLDIGDPEATMTVMKQLEGDYVNLSKQKFSSNVVEKCLKMHQVGIEALRERIIKELSESDILSQLLQDSYGNYVVQSALAYSTGELHECLVEAIKPHLAALKNTPQGKRIMQKINTK
eukprot:TRINITY_DN20121_c0_g1_i2.p1 TRINITY_DN20121_c0_g1~~TRINITY_DN20121_c0_g1_i2.p1  ORF type:complete len:681 (-),score=141.98 TRINITY_DN20121_c0_g1_i2:1301-3343(-)